RRRPAGARQRNLALHLSLEPKSRAEYAVGEVALTAADEGRDPHHPMPILGSLAARFSHRLVCKDARLPAPPPKSCMPQELVGFHFSSCDPGSRCFGAMRPSRNVIRLEC